MQEEKENDKNTSLVPIGSKGLVRLRNSIAITEKMKSVKSIHEMEVQTDALFELIELTFVNMSIKADFLEYSQGFYHYIERIKIHQDVLQKLNIKNNDGDGNKLL